MKWRAFCHMPQWVRLSDLLGRTLSRQMYETKVVDFRVEHPYQLKLFGKFQARLNKSLSWDSAV